MAAADYRLMTEATGQRIAAALEALSGTGAAAAAARANLDVYSTGETDELIAQSTAVTAFSNLGGHAIYARKTGRVAMLSFSNSTAITADAGETFLQLPAELIPATAISFTDTNNNRRINISASGAVAAPQALSGVSLRGIVTYITAS